MGFIKKLFCTHDYEYFGCRQVTENYGGFVDCQNREVWKCTKCDSEQVRGLDHGTNHALLELDIKSLEREIGC